MKDTADHNSSAPIDIQGYEDLMELVFAYSLAAKDFGFTHKMNNRFTSLSMNASFLKQALEKEDVEKATAKAEQISESINSLVAFSQNLMNTELLRGGTQEIEFPSMLSDTLEKLLGLPTFTGIDLNADLSDTVLKTQANPKIIWIFLYAFLKHAKRYTIDGPILLTSHFDEEHGQYIIKTDVKQILHAPATMSEESSLSFPSAGEVPLRYLVRVIHDATSRYEMVHREQRPLTLELKLKLPLDPH